MSITIKTINNNEYTFVNNSRGNRSGFVHTTQLYKNGTLWGNYKIQYINRTWECYQYQSVMRGVVNAIIGEEFERFKENWKSLHNVKRLTKARYDLMMEDFSKIKPSHIAEFEQLYTML